MDYLPLQNKRCEGDAIKESQFITAKDKHVVIIGGGDTGADCLGTAHRQGAKSVHQLELLPKPPAIRAADNPWPQWPNIFRVSAAHEEGGERLYSVATSKFLGDDKGRVRALAGSSVQPVKEDGRLTFKPVPGTEFELAADLVLLAMGFTGAEGKGLVGDLGLAMTPRGTVQRDATLDDERARGVRHRRHAARPVADRLGDRRRPQHGARRRRVPDGRVRAAGAGPVARFSRTPAAAVQDAWRRPPVSRGASDGLGQTADAGAHRDRDGGEDLAPRRLGLGRPARVRPQLAIERVQRDRPRRVAGVARPIDQRADLDVGDHDLRRRVRQVVQQLLADGGPPRVPRPQGQDHAHGRHQPRPARPGQRQNHAVPLCV